MRHWTNISPAASGVEGSNPPPPGRIAFSVRLLGAGNHAQEELLWPGGGTHPSHPSAKGA